MSTIHKLEHQTYVLMRNGKPTVRCEVEHFVHSGLTIEELFAVLHADMMGVVRDIAAAHLDATACCSPVRAGCDVGHCDPQLTFDIVKPHAFLADELDGFDRLRKMAASLLATNASFIPKGGCNA